MKKILFSLSLLFVFSLAFAAPPTSPYAPGETLDPSCDPGDTNCSVDISIAPRFVATSTTATSTYAGNVSIDGKLRIDGALYAGSSAGFSGYVLQSTGAGIAWVATSTLGIGGGSEVWSLNGSSAYYNAGNVGIGTSSPTEKLVLTGGNMLVDYGSTIYFGGTDASSAFITTDGSQFGPLVVGSSNGVFVEGKLASSDPWWEVVGNNGTSFKTNDGTRGFRWRNNDDTDMMTLDPNGDLSLGTTSPYMSSGLFSADSYPSRLSVSGTTTIQGKLRLAQPLTGPDASAMIIGDISGNDRGAFAIDLQTWREDPSYVASAAYSIALGFNNTADESNGLAIGHTNLASAFQALAIGTENIANGVASIALGTENETASGGTQNIAIGYNNSTADSYSTAIGTGNQALGNQTFAFGLSNVISSTSTAAVAIGHSNTISNGGIVDSYAIGYSNDIYQGQSSALGYENTIFTNSGTAVGLNNIVNGQSGLAVGHSNEVSGAGYASAFGSGNEATNVKATAVGHDNIVGGILSSAFGNANTANVAVSLAMGYTNQALNEGSLALGFMNTASADYAVAIGNSVTNSTANSVMIGPSDSAKMTILSSGNVGIGTTTPEDKLTVVGTSTVWGTLRVNYAPIRSAGFYDPDNTLYPSLMLGEQAGEGVTSTSRSLFAGYQSGINGHNIQDSIIIGDEAGWQSTDINNTSIFGQFSGASMNNVAYTTIVGDNAGYSSYNINSSDFFGSGAGSYSYDNNGLSAIGYYAGYTASESYGSMFAGYYAGSNSVNLDNLSAVGYYSGFNAVDGSNSDFFGYYAGADSENMNSMSIFGYYAGRDAIDGTQSSFLGYYAGNSADNSDYSTFVGYHSGEYSTDVVSSNFFGANSGGYTENIVYSTYLGTYAGQYSQNNEYSNFFGYLAGAETNGASNSIFIGRNAGWLDPVSNSNVYLEEESSILLGNFTSTGGFSNSIAIGQGTANDAENQLNIGRVIYATGIGSTTVASSSPIFGGRVGIGITAPAYTLHVVGDDGSGNVAKFETGSGATSCTLSAVTGLLSCSSDLRLKKDIESLSASSSLEKILELRPVSYHWKTEDSSDALKYGFIAQEMEEVFPMLVSTDSQTGIKSIGMSGIIPFLVDAVQEIARQVDELRQGMFGQVKTDLLCVGDTCLTEAQLKKLLENSDVDSAPDPDPAPDTDTETDEAPAEEIPEEPAEEDAPVAEEEEAPAEEAPAVEEPAAPEEAPSEPAPTE